MFDNLNNLFNYLLFYTPFIGERSLLALFDGLLWPILKHREKLVTDLCSFFLLIGVFVLQVCSLSSAAHTKAFGQIENNNRLMTLLLSLIWFLTLKISKSPLL